MRMLGPSCLLALLAVSSAHSDTAVLDGTTWLVEAMPDPAATKPGAEPFQATLVFGEGVMSVTASGVSVLSAAPYTLEARPNDKLWSFTAEHADSDFREIWSGTVRGDAMEGKVVLASKDGTFFAHSFSGRRDGSIDARPSRR